MQLSSEARKRIIRDLVAILGESYVKFEPQDTFELNKTLIYRNDQERKNIYVFPGSREEVVAIVKLANELRFPIWACGRGQNWGYGTMATTFEEGVVLNMNRMNRILEVNAELAYAVIEPGVTYQQLHRYLIDHQIPLQIDCNDSSPSCSVIGNALERGIGVTPYADHFGNLCGLEVVSPTGVCFKTGGGFERLDKNFHLYKYGTGPYIEGLFSQSGFGVVVTAGIQLMPKPKDYTSFIFEFETDEAYLKGVEVLRDLQLRDVIRSRIHLCNDVTTLCLFRQYPYELLGEGQTCLDDAHWSELRRKYGISRWSAAGGLFGTSGELRVAKKLIRKSLGKYAKIQFIGQSEALLASRMLKAARNAGWFGSLVQKVIELASGKHPDMVEVFQNSYGLLSGTPTEFFVRHAYFKASIPTPRENVHPARDQCGCLWFAPLVPNTAKDVRIFTERFRGLFQRHGFDYYAAQLMMPRCSIILLSIFFKKDDPEEYGRAMELYRELCRNSSELGYQQYRTSTLYMSEILNGAPEFRNFLRQMKKSVDPHSVLFPGKYGI